MSLLIRGLLSVTIIGSAIATSALHSAIAAEGQTLAQCVKELNDAYPNYVGITTFSKHVQTCSRALASQPATESLGQCVSGLNKIYPEYVGSTTNDRHVEACSALLQTQQSNRTQPQQSPGGVIFVQPVQPTPSGNPQAIAGCMKKLLYTRQLVCTRTGFPGCSHFPSEGFGGWEMQDVRTEVSESAAVQACQGAR